MNLKRELIIVFHPYVKPGELRQFRYRVISANSLPAYIGALKCKTELERFMESGKEKHSFYVSLKGMVYLYRK